MAVIRCPECGFGNCSGCGDDYCLVCGAPLTDAARKEVEEEKRRVSEETPKDDE